MYFFCSSSSKTRRIRISLVTQPDAPTILHRQIESLRSMLEYSSIHQRYAYLSFVWNGELHLERSQEYFLKISPAPYTLPGFHVSSIKECESLIVFSCVVPLIDAGVSDLQGSLDTTSILPPDPQTEIVLFVGLPCLGKSTFFRTHFAPAGYVHVNQDTLGSRPKCVRAAEEALEAGKSCVIGPPSTLSGIRVSYILFTWMPYIDNTNRNVQTRKYFLDVAKRLKVPAR